MPAPDVSTTILIRLGNLEKDVKELEVRFNEYTPERVNDLRFQGIQDALARIGVDVKEMKDLYKDLNTKIIAQQDNQNKRDIRVLIFAVTSAITILGGILIGYVTHFFH